MTDRFSRKYWLQLRYVTPMTTQALAEIHRSGQDAVHMVNALLRVNDYSSYNELHQGGKAHDISTFHCIHQPQFSLRANLSWPFILKKSPNISPVFNFCCASCRSFFPVCLNTLHFLPHLCLFLPSPIPISCPLLPAQQRGKVGEFS